MERMRAEREGGRERSPVQNRCCFVRLLEFYVPTYPANYVAPPFPLSLHFFCSSETQRALSSVLQAEPYIRYTFYH